MSTNSISMSKTTTLTKYIPWLLFLFAAAYYCSLSVRSYTWLYVSQDSGDWLMASTIWTVPQPLGSPLYIFLGHLLHAMHLNLEIAMPLLLSALPSAITVVLVYLIAERVSKSWFIALTSSLVLVGAFVFLSQSTILEEYALATMFLVSAYWFYLRKEHKLTMLSLGLGTAVHIIGLVFFLMFIYIERKEWRLWTKPILIYMLTGIAPYIYVPVLMMLHTPPFMAGYWSLSALFAYMFRTANGVLFQISVYDFPQRLWVAGANVVVSLSIAIIPVVIAILKKPYDKAKWILVLFTLFPFVYYLLCIDMTTWTYLTFGLPFACILAATALADIDIPFKRLVTIGAIIFIVLNVVYLNSGVLARSNDIAGSVKTEMLSLPQSSMIVTYPGTYSMCSYYVWTQRNDIVPIVWQENGSGEEVLSYADLKPQYQSYNLWLSEQYGIRSTLPIQQIEEWLAAGRPVYIASHEWMLTEGVGEDVSWTTLVKQRLVMQGTGRIRQIIAVKE